MCSDVCRRKRNSQDKPWTPLPFCSPDRFERSAENTRILQKLFLHFPVGALTSSEHICLKMFWTSVTCTILAEFSVFLSLTFLTIGCYFFKTIYFIIYHFFGINSFYRFLKDYGSNE